MGTEKREMGYMPSYYKKGQTPEEQAEQIWKNQIEPHLKTENGNGKIGILYAANKGQSDGIINNYSSGGKTISGSGQALLFAALQAKIKAAGLEDRVHILPIASSVSGGSDASPSNRVDKASLDRDLANVVAHKEAGFKIVGLGRSSSYDPSGKPYKDGEPRAPTDPKEFSIGGGNSEQFVKDQSFSGGGSRHQYMQQQLEAMMHGKSLDSGIEAQMDNARKNLGKAAPKGPQPSQPQPEEPKQAKKEEPKKPQPEEPKQTSEKNPPPPKKDEKVEITLESLMPKDASEQSKKLFENIFNHYNSFCKDESGAYKEGFSAPKFENNTARVTFPDAKSSTDFLRGFAEQNPQGNFSVKNDQGEIIARIESGKLKLFDGENGFKEADENSVLPKSGMSAEAFSKLGKEPTPKPDTSFEPDLSSPQDSGVQNPLLALTSPLDETNKSLTGSMVPDEPESTFDSHPK